MASVPMREDCRHFESRTYDDGEVARFCELDLAPEAPWRCPEQCPRYERSLIDATFVTGSLAADQVEAEPSEETPDDVETVLDEAAAIVQHAEADVVADLEHSRGRRRWWRRRPPESGPDDFRLSDR
jgi:hypothetical protein